MSDVPLWNLFAYFNDDEDGAHDESRVVAEWQIDDVVRWCRHRGYDTILLSRTNASRKFAKHRSQGVRHSGSPHS